SCSHCSASPAAWRLRSSPPSCWRDRAPPAPPQPPRCSGRPGSRSPAPASPGGSPPLSAGPGGPRPGPPPAPPVHTPPPHRPPAAPTRLSLATGLATALLHMQTSQTSAAVHAYTDNLRADVVLSSPAGGLPVGLARVVRKQPGVAGASALVTSTGFFEQPGENAASVPLQGIDAAGAAETTRRDLTAATAARLRGNTVALATTDARPGRGLGDTVRMRL